MLIHLNTFFLLLFLPSVALSQNPRVLRRASRQVPAAGFVDPRSNGGSFLTQVANTNPPGQAEPVNVIISATSDEQVLIDQEDDGGLRNYFLSLSFAGECLGQHAGDKQQLNLGDGDGLLDETAVLRFDFMDPQLGTCRETVQGGDHFRYWQQNGPDANTGAVFMAASYELPIAQGHDIIQDGYDLGRDRIVGNISGTVIPTADLTNQSSFSGKSSFNGFEYLTTIKYLSGFLQNTSIGINHNGSVPVGGRNAIDGLVAFLEVKINSRPTNDATAIFLNPPTRTPLIPILSVAFIISLACL